MCDFVISFHSFVTFIKDSTFNLSKINLKSQYAIIMNKINKDTKTCIILRKSPGRYLFFRRRNCEESIFTLEVVSSSKQMSSDKISPD